MKNKENATITFYPDAFFGTAQLYSPYRGKYNNRLADYMFSPIGGTNEEDFTIEQVKELIDLVNKVNQEHDKEGSNSYGV